MGVSVGRVEEGGGHLEAFRKCVVKVSLRSVGVGFGHGRHREGSGGLYQNDGSPPKGLVVVPSEVCSKAGWVDNIPGRFCRAVKMG